MLTKQDKEKFVKEGVEKIKKYKVVGVLPLNSIPDSLLQSSRNKLRSDINFIIGKKSLLTMILESSEETKKLESELKGTSAIILSNENPFELYKRFSANSMKLAAKPNQKAIDDINIAEGETSLQPGQGVTELKSAGIDVKIDKGKVVISKSKVLVKKGDTISNLVAKALHTLDMKPFTATLVPSAIMYEHLKFGREALSITSDSLKIDIAHAFSAAYNLSLDAGFINLYTIKPMISKAYTEAMALGINAKIYDTGITEKLLEIAAAEAKSLNEKVGE
ncbi:acidic ribosomal protein P0 [Candidatus Mancarchaeum acidiphilum]|uniref:Acidic ribosomal protein P0 n=1 Tax=Candidatus Mancarchaeum acidiphilum TaxID=1920749 RepID=A0A218NNK5_9ARCH|nr:50S ribosomal protein L10 [Candidatus Mancarchaeum acidiphilum]ASI14051.1 acidic ribosomal protein P0 [Candidatus Mancarchaeum acidiphilum]